MMENRAKLKIYQGIIQYLLDTTNYSLENIADLTDTSIKNIRLIHCDHQIPLNFSTELQLLNLYHIVLELKIHQRTWTKCSSSGRGDV